MLLVPVWVYICLNAGGMIALPGPVHDFLLQLPVIGDHPTLLLPYLVLAVSCVVLPLLGVVNGTFLDRGRNRDYAQRRGNTPVGAHEH